MMPRVAMMVDAEAPKLPRRPILKPVGRPRSFSQEKHVRFLMPEKLPDAFDGGAEKAPSITATKLRECKHRRRRKRAMAYLPKSSPTVRDRTSRVDASVHELYRNYFPDASEVPHSSSNGGVKASDPTRRPLFSTSPRDKSKSPRNILLSPSFIGSRGKRLRQIQRSVDENRQHRENASPSVTSRQRRLDMDFVSKPIGSPALKPPQRKPSQSCRNLRKACAQDVFDWAASDRSSSSAILSENCGGAPIIADKSSVSMLEKESCSHKIDDSCTSTPSASHVMQGLTDDSTFQQGETKDEQVTSTVASQAASAHCAPSASVEVPEARARASLQSSESLTDEKREVDAGRALGPIPADAKQEAQPAEEALLASAEKPDKIEGNCIDTPINAVVTAECERNRTEDPGLSPLSIPEGPVALQASMCDVFSPTKGLLSPMKGLVVASPQQQQLHTLLHSLTPELVHGLQMQPRSGSHMPFNDALDAVESPQAVLPVEKRDVALQTDPEIEHNHSGDKEKMELEEGEFYVERILSHRNDANGEREFLIRWHGHSAADDSWEPESNLISGAEKLVLDYFRMKQESVPKQEQELLSLRKHQVLVILAGSGGGDVDDGFWLFELTKSYEVASDDFDALLEGFYYTRLERNSKTIVYGRMQPKLLDLVQLDNVLPGPRNAQLRPRFQRVVGHSHLRRLAQRSLERIEEALTKLQL